MALLRTNLDRRSSQRCSPLKAPTSRATAAEAAAALTAAAAAGVSAVLRGSILPSAPLRQPIVCFRRKRIAWDAAPPPPPSHGPRRCHGVPRQGSGPDDWQRRPPKGRRSGTVGRATAAAVPGPVALESSTGKCELLTSPDPGAARPDEPSFSDAAELEPYSGPACCLARVQIMIVAVGV